MGVKLPYTYTIFRNCPEATEISHSREKGKVLQYTICGLIFVFSILFCFVNSADRWIAICGVIICPMWFVYLIKFYDKKTNELIIEAFERNKSSDS